jgi:hypothetical protein
MRLVAAFSLSLVFVARCLSAPGDEERFGTLPAGMVNTSEISDVFAEIARDHLFDPAKVVARLPAGYRLITAAECAREDPAVAALLKASPQYAHFGVGSLVFMSVGKFLVDGASVSAPGRTPMAFWWARAEGPRDSRMQGKVQWVQLASWYSREMSNRAPVIANDPTAEFVELRVEEAGPGVWRLHLALADDVIDAEVRTRGEPVKRRASTEKFMSVPMAGKGAGSFWVITYHGHHHRPAHGGWRSRGSGVFSAAWRIPGEAENFGAFFQSHWSALSGLYQGLEPAQ